MTTQPLYLQDAYLKEMDAKILETIPEGEKRWQLVLDKTIFYPMGGGQPTDQGLLSSKNWQGKVYQVLQRGDKIIHFVEAQQIPPIGSSVQGAINWERRYLHMRLHSAGHVVDFALFLLGLSPHPLMPFKGDHGKKPVIWYLGTIENDFRESLEKKAAELIKRDLKFSFRFVNFDELEREAIYVQPGLPKNKPLRLLTLEGIGSVADGGTQVHHTSEIGSIMIPKIEINEGMTLVHYRI
ncbi:MAG: alanyl-tRNA editing protein [Chlamydiae bacterium]|nr:alanyl-tRNA editing protein [Chlamydiota bacterium]